MKAPTCYVLPPRATSSGLLQLRRECGCIQLYRKVETGQSFYLYYPIVVAVAVDVAVAAVFNGLNPVSEADLVHSWLYYLQLLGQSTPAYSPV